MRQEYPYAPYFAPGANGQIHINLGGRVTRLMAPPLVAALPAAIGIVAPAPRPAAGNGVRDLGRGRSFPRSVSVTIVLFVLGGALLILGCHKHSASSYVGT
jgi:hypothetical protein